MPVLIDTSVWIDHFATTNQMLADLLTLHWVLIHPLVIGELACGNLKDREKVIQLLDDLPVARVAAHDEVMRFIMIHKIYGKGVGYTDVSLLASVMLQPGLELWSADKRLAELAGKHGVRFNTH